MLIKNQAWRRPSVTHCPDHIKSLTSMNEEILTWLILYKSSQFTSCPKGIRFAKTHALSSFHSWLTTILTWLALAGVILTQIVFNCFFQVQFFDRGTWHFLHQLIEGCQLYRRHTVKNSTFCRETSSIH